MVHLGMPGNSINVWMTALWPHTLVAKGFQLLSNSRIASKFFKQKNYLHQLAGQFLWQHCYFLAKICFGCWLEDQLALICNATLNNLTLAKVIKISINEASINFRKAFITVCHRTVIYEAHYWYSNRTNLFSAKQNLVLFEDVFYTHWVLFL